MSNPTTFECDGHRIPPNERRHLRYPVGETYLGDEVEIPVTIVNGAHPGPTLFITAAIHGDELNGVKVIQEVATMYDPADLHGTLVCLHVVNVPAYNAQQRYIPIYDQDLNRAFPGRKRSTTAERMAYRIYHSLISKCDFGIDLHTSTRNRTTMYHVRADLDDPAVERLARAFGASVVLFGSGNESSLRSVATNDGIPTITVEMGRAHRFQPTLIEKAIEGIDSILAEFGMCPGRPVRWPGWYVFTSIESEKRWLRADIGGIVDMHWGPYPLVHEGDPICTISNHAKTVERVVEAPFTGLIIGSLENPVALPGHPLCHLVKIDAQTRSEIEDEITSGEFDGYRVHEQAWKQDVAPDDIGDD